MRYPEFEDKIKSLHDILSLLARLRQAGKTIVTNNGSYDLMHVGHLYGLFEAKRQGDVLIVGLNSDCSIKTYKGDDRPINDETMRSLMLAAISAVDYVFLFNDTTPLNWLEQVKPDIHTNGAEYGEACIEKETVERNGGKLYLLSMIDGYKSSNIIEKIRNGCP